jgi:hypothetical protein
VGGNGPADCGRQHDPDGMAACGGGAFYLEALVMSDKKWVQHISGQGEKWEVVQDYPTTSQWGVKVGKGFAAYYHWLPKSEYRLCEPPEVWVDVTDQCVITESGLVRLDHENGTHTYASSTSGYRFRKIVIPEGYAFIVERKQS